MTDPARIFIVEDEAIIAADIAAMLESVGHGIAGIAGTGAEAVEKIRAQRPDLALVDIMIGGSIDGIALAQQLRENDIPVVFLTAYADAQSLQRAKITEPYGYVLKPFTDRDLHIAVDIALYRYRMDKQMRATMRQINRVRTALDQVADMLIMAKEDGTVIYVNKAFETMTGLNAAEIIGKSIHEDPRLQAHPAMHQKIWETVRSGSVWAGRFTTLNSSGEEIELEASITPVRSPEGEIESFIGIARDVTRERELERQLRHAQKLEAIGTLAGGIAHDFNNILAAIIGYTELASVDAVPDSKQAGYLQHVLAASERARRLVQQILTFSRRSEQTVQPLQLTPLVKETVKLLQAAIPVSVEINTVFSAQHDWVLGDPTQLHQMLMNLCINAADAIGSKHGTVTIELAEQRLPDAEQRTVLGLNPDADYIELSVSDTGCGIPEELLDRIFDPFFTTKAEGKGTGLGLSVVHGIVKSHNGAITVKSTPGHGSCFTIYLPQSHELEKQQHTAPEQIQRGSGSILLVDDEQSIVDIGMQILTRLGYKVTGICDAREALALFHSTPDAFDVVITDYTMPRLTGDELIREIHSVRADIPIVLCTGYSDKMTREDALALGAQEFALKPLTQAMYAEVVHNVLNQSTRQKQVKREG
ncbi:MAG: response regulator [Desulfobacterota bacterium]|nr:response regulator [Thermodesulfobacteriota bacterium]